MDQNNQSPVQQEVPPLAPQAAPTPQSAPNGHQPTGENPGQTLGIISIVLDVVGFALIGLILGVISRKKSKEAGHPTTLGTIGMVLGIIFTVLGFLSFLFFVILMIIGAAAASSSTAPSSEPLFESDSSQYQSL